MDDEEAIKESVGNLRDAILLGRTDIVRSILSTASEFREEGELFGEDEEENDPLARQRYFEEYNDPYDILKIILNYIDSDAGTCLHLATKLGYSDAVRALLAAGSDPTITNKEGATAFDYCTDKNILCIYNEELLQAAAGGNIPRVIRLLKCGVSSNANDGADSDNKILHWAACYGTYDVVKLLCENNADVNVTNAEGSTPLHDAVNRGDIEIIQTLLEFGADPNIKATSGVLKGKSPTSLASDEEIKCLLARYSNNLEKKPIVNGEIHINGKDLSDAESSNSNLSVDTISLLPTASPVSRARQLSSESPTHSNDPLLALLWPPPQRVLEMKGGRYFPPALLPIQIHRPKTDSIREICTMWEVLESQFEQAGYAMEKNILSEGCETDPVPAGSIECKICPNLFTRPESYKIHITSIKVTMIASEKVSLWYAINTLLQLLRLFQGKGIPMAQIMDWPDIKHRGILIDVSTGRVPKLETLLSIIDMLSSVKINQLQIYMQNTFAYRGHDSVYRNYTPYTQSDIIKLDKYCRERYIELVPHIESLSGFSQWLKFKQYSHLSEITRDLNTMDDTYPCSICPSSQDSVNFVLDLHKQIFPCFSSNRYAHVGIDVTDEFGKGKSCNTAKDKGKEELYLDYVRHMYNSCQLHGRTMQFWSNSLQDNPEILWSLPSDIIAMEYGGKVGCDFMKHCKLLSDAGVSFFVCPGSLTWNSACGNTDDSLVLINNAAQTAVTCDALGILLCDWSLPGHVNPIHLSIPAFFATAGLSWKADTELASVQSNLPTVVSRHAFLDSTSKFGQALNDLGKIHALLASNEADQDTSVSNCPRSVHPMTNPTEGTLLWRTLQDGGNPDLTGVGLDSVQQAARLVRQCQNTYNVAEMKCAHSTDMIKELDVTVDILLYLCRLCRMLLLAKKQNADIKTLDDLPPINKTDLANRLLELIAHYQKVYLLRNRHGGLLSAKQQLQKMLLQLLPQENQT